MKTPFTVAILATLSFPLTSLAETQLHPIVTASRIAQTADQTLAAVTVINKEDIESSQTQSLAELLRDRVPAMDFLTTGGTGHQTSVFLRGTNSDHVLFMIDGNIIGSATTGAAALELIPLEQIDHIEIVRGPRSSLYGSDAIGGVIQVFTKSGFDGENAAISYGSNNTRAVDAAISTGSADTQLTLSANHYKTDGFNATNDREDDNDGYTNNAININIHHKTGNASSIHAQFLRAEGNTEFDNDSANNESDSIQQNLSIGIDTAFSDQWSTSISAGQSQDRLETSRYYEDFFTPGTFIFSPSLFETRRDQAHWQNKLSFGESAQVAFGLDYNNDTIESTTSYAENQRDNKAMYALAQDKFGRHQLQISGRADDNEAFGVHRTGNIAWSYDISGTIHINASHGTAFIAPTFNDLYYVDPFFNGNPNLNPETSRSTELGLTGGHNWGQWDIRAYHTEIENLIINVSTNPADPFAPFTTANADKAVINGAELEINGALIDWNTNLSFSVIDPVNKNTNTILQNRARQTLKLNLSRFIGDHQIGINALSQSSRFADVNNTIELPGYTVFNLTVETIIDKRWRLKTRMENVFDKEYSTSTDFFGNTTNNTPISLFVTLSYQN